MSIFIAILCAKMSSVYKPKMWSKTNHFTTFSKPGLKSKFLLDILAVQLMQSYNQKLLRIRLR